MGPFFVGLGSFAWPVLLISITSSPATSSPHPLNNINFLHFWFHPVTDPSSSPDRRENNVETFPLRLTINFATTASNDTSPIFNDRAPPICRTVSSCSGLSLPPDCMVQSSPSNQSLIKGLGNFISLFIVGSGGVLLGLETKPTIDGGHYVPLEWQTIDQAMLNWINREYSKISAVCKERPNPSGVGQSQYHLHLFTTFVNFLLFIYFVLLFSFSMYPYSNNIINVRITIFVCYHFMPQPLNRFR